MPTEERKGMSHLDTTRTRDCTSSETNYDHILADVKLSS